MTCTSKTQVSLSGQILGELIAGITICSIFCLIFIVKVSRLNKEQNSKTFSVEINEVYKCRVFEKLKERFGQVGDRMFRVEKHKLQKFELKLAESKSIIAKKFSPLIKKIQTLNAYLTNSVSWVY
jgi:hypothetical protein